MEEKKQESKEKESFSTKLKKYIKNLFDFSKYDLKTKAFIVLFLILFGISIYLLYYVYFVDSTFLYRIVILYFVNPLFKLGFLGYLAFLGAMVLQAIAVPIPSEILLVAAGMIWGFWVGGFMGIAGSMICAMFAYYVGKNGGRPIAEKFVGKGALDLADNFVTKYGIIAIIIARCLPFVAFDPISYISGVSKVPAKKYAIGTLIGVIPRAFFYAFLGASLNIKPPVNLENMPLDEIERQSETFNTLLLIVLVVLVAMFVTYYLLNRILIKKKQKTMPNIKTEEKIAEKIETSEKETIEKTENG